MAGSDDAKDVITTLRSQGWCQGVVIDKSTLFEIYDDEVVALRTDLVPSNFNCAIVLSQDCDIVHHSLENEPEVELVLCNRSSSQADGNLRHGKNPRQLHLEYEDGRIAVEIRDRVWVPKQSLAKFEPDDTLDDESTDTLIRWVARRYLREAFPDAFNNRLRSIQKKLSKLSKKASAGPVSGLFIEIEPFAELDAAEPYEVRFIVAFKQSSKRAEVEKYTKELRELLNNCEGIDLSDESRCLHHAEITLDEIESMKRWTDFDYRSIGGTSSENALLDADVR